MRRILIINKIINGETMAEKVSKEQIEREDGYLYYLGKNGYIWKSPMRSNTRGKKARVGSEKIQRAEGYLYFLDKKGYVSRTEMKRRTSKKSRK